jgi:hypothetical protein
LPSKQVRSRAQGAQRRGRMIQQSLQREMLLLAGGFYGPVPGKELPEFGQCFVPGFTGSIGGQRELRFSLQQLRHPFRAGLPNRRNSVPLNNVEGRNHVVPFRKFAEPGRLAATGPGVKLVNANSGATGTKAAAFEKAGERLSLRQPRWPWRHVPPGRLQSLRQPPGSCRRGLFARYCCCRRLEGDAGKTSDRFAGIPDIW